MRERFSPPVDPTGEKKYCSEYSAKCFGQTSEVTDELKFIVRYSFRTIQRVSIGKFVLPLVIPGM